jgi:fibronectin type 3 domain-containing protein
MKRDESVGAKYKKLVQSKLYFCLTVILICSLSAFISMASSIEANAAEVTLAWDANAEPGIEGYNLYYGSSSRNYPDKIDVGNVTISTIKKLQEGQTYYFAVTAYDTGRNESLFSEEISYTVPPANQVFTITASASANGSIFPSGMVLVNSGGNQSFTITADSGYQISDVLVNDKSVGAVESYTFKSVQSDQTLQVTFISLAENQPPKPTAGLLPESVAASVPLTPLLEIEGYSDPDSNDVHGATHWQIALDGSFDELVFDHIATAFDTNGCLVNLLVPPGVLFSNRIYYWRARVKDARESGYLWSDWSEVKSFTTGNMAYSDNNGNGVPDDIEPAFSDLDGDGQNDNDQSLMRVATSESASKPIGIKAVDGVSRVNYYNCIESESLQAEPSPVPLPYGLLNFNLEVDRIGGTAVLEIYPSGEASGSAQAFKYDVTNGWYSFPIKIINGKYVIEITDGGRGDVDGIANGIVVDPIGLSVTSGTVNAALQSDGASGGGGGCFVGAAGLEMNLSRLLDFLLF